VKQIYEQPTRILIRHMIDELAGSPDKIFTREDALDWFGKNYPKLKRSTVTTHLTRFSTNAEARIHTGFRPGEEDLLYQIDSKSYRRCDPLKDPAPLHSKADVSAVAEKKADVPQEEAPSEFAYERDLQNFLAKNLTLFEPGLELYQDDEGVTGIEFDCGGRFIDILAIDAQKGLVVIELKVSRGYDRVVGQILRYIGWIKANHAEVGQGVRGIIAAREITDDLRLACSSLPDVSLYEYELSVKLLKVNCQQSTKAGI
jgi:hypothetical protein